MRNKKITQSDYNLDTCVCSKHYKDTLLKFVMINKFLKKSHKTCKRKYCVKNKSKRVSLLFLTKSCLSLVIRFFLFIFVYCSIYQRSHSCFLNLCTNLGKRDVKKSIYDPHLVLAQYGPEGGLLWEGSQRQWLAPQKAVLTSLSLQWNELI